MKDRYQCDEGLNITRPVVRYDFSMPKWYQTNTVFFVAVLMFSILALFAIVGISLIGV